MALKRGERIFPGIEDEVALVQAKGTISNLVDAIIELVTNSDDSYSSIEQEGRNTTGKIEIYVKKSKSGNCQEVQVSDEASGMTPDKLENVICYGRKTSELYAGKSARGFFGRGLKESILALGSGEILTVAEGKKTHGQYYYDFDKNKLTWITLDAGSETEESSFTKVIIRSSEDRPVKCPDFDKLLCKLRDHFALRNILSNPKRYITIIVEKRSKIDGPRRLWYIAPAGQQIENRKIYLKGLGIVDFNLYESHERLPFSRNDPESQAGILIKTSNAILENQLFGFDNDPDAHYFFGEIRCPGIFQKIKEGEKGIIRSDRKGIYWSYECCADLEKEIKLILAHHIERKKKQAEFPGKKQQMPVERAYKLLKLLKKLNSLGRELLGETGLGPDSIPDDFQISHLTIYPPEASAAPDQDRAFSVYNLTSILKDNAQVRVSLDDPKGKFPLSSDSIILRKHVKREDLVFGYFKIKGFRPQDKTGIIVRQGKDEDYAEFTVGIEKKKRKAKSNEPPKKQKGGLFKEVIFDTFDRNPPQRVFYDRNTGVIRIYIYYPGVFPYLGENGDGSETERGSLLLSELVGEAFCRETARRKVDKDIFDPEAKLDQYLKVYNDHLKLCVPIIHSIFLS
jgi:hypothetical protein